MKSTADRLLGDAYEWSVLGAGRHQFEMITASAVMGSHVRVGLEDGLFIGRGQLAESNAEQVAKIRRILDRALDRDRHAGRGPGRSSGSRVSTRSAGERRGRQRRPRQPTRSGTVTVVGTGVIGGGWAAHFLRRGYDVVAWDPGPDAEERLTGLLDTAWPSLERLGLSPGASRDRLRWADTLEEALAGTDFVQESSPEVLDAKVALLAEIDRLRRPGRRRRVEHVRALMTDMAVGVRHTPAGSWSGHPFNPPYLIPLVEVVGGRQTDPEAVAWAEAFYTAPARPA